MMQLEFDREHDLLVSAQEKHHNKNSKSKLLLLCSLHFTFYFIIVAISFDKYRSVHPALSEADEFNDDDVDSGDNEEIPQHSPNSAHGSGKKRRAKRSTETTPTKHDPYVCGRRNVRNMEKVILTM